jgi:glycosyltransferase involved in cell wall biosynthesis
MTSGMSKLLEKPILTVAVCTYRRFDCLDRCLAALQRQSDVHFQLVVVDNSCLPSQSKQCRDKWLSTIELDYVITEQSGLSFARNTALQMAHTPFIAYLDDDAVPAKTWAAGIMRAAERVGDSLGVLGGPVRPIWEAEKPAWLRDELLGPVAVVDWGGREFTFRPDDDRWLVGANIVYRVEALKQVGGFDVSLGRKEELPLCHEELAATAAVRSLGYSMVYDPNVEVEHLVQRERLSPEWMFRDAYWETISRCLYRGELMADDLLSRQRELVRALDRAIPADVGAEASYRSVVSARETAAALARRVVGKIPAASPRGQGASAAPHRSELVVVLPVLNGIAGIERTIASVLAQEGDFLVRLHVQDGGSTDGTREVLEAVRTRLSTGSLEFGARDVRFTVGAGPDDGLYDAISQGARAVAGSSDSPMTWINSGDFFLPGAFAAVSRVFADLPEVSWVIPPVFVFAGGMPRRYSQVDYPRSIVAAGLCDGLNWPTIQQEGSFWRRSLWSDAGEVVRSLQLAGDWALWREFAKRTTPFQMTWPVAAFTVAPGQLSSSSNKYQAEILRYRSATAAKKATSLILKAPSNLNVAVIDQDFRVDRKVLNPDRLLEEGWRQELIEALAGSSNPSRRSGGPPLEKASSQELITELARRDPLFKSKWGGPEYENEGRSRLFQLVRSAYRRLPESWRYKMRPLIRRLFGR